MALARMAFTLDPRHYCAWQKFINERLAAKRAEHNWIAAEYQRGHCGNAFDNPSLTEVSKNSAANVSVKRT